MGDEHLIGKYDQVRRYCGKWINALQFKLQSRIKELKIWITEVTINFCVITFGRPVNKPDQASHLVYRTKQGCR